VVAIEQRGRGEVLRSCRDGALPFGCRALDGGVAGEACEPGLKRTGLRIRAHGYNLANFLRTLALPGEIADWSLTSLREKVVKIGAKVVAHGRYLIFQMAEGPCPGSCSGASSSGSRGSARRSWRDADPARRLRCLRLPGLRCVRRPSDDRHPGPQP